MFVERENVMKGKYISCIEHKTRKSPFRIQELPID